LSAGFVKKPRQHYGVVYVFCLTSSQNSPDQETRFILFAFLSVVICGLLDHHFWLTTQYLNKLGKVFK
jgi:hypothetical protein